MSDRKELEKRLKELTKAHQKLENHISELEKNFVKRIVEETIIELNRKKEHPLKNEILYRFNRNKKELILRKIVDNIGEKKLELAELKYIMVDHLCYCSKPSFYRYIAELESKGLVEFMLVGRKQFITKKQEIIIGDY